MTPKKKLEALTIDEYGCFIRLESKLKGYGLVNAPVPVGGPFPINIGCPRDTLPMYHWVWGRESNIYNELLKRDLPANVNAYSSSDKSFILDDAHHIVAVQLYRVE